MTTTVNISSPIPNHEDVLVEVQSLDVEGNWKTSYSFTLNEGQSKASYVYGNQRLIVTEKIKE